MAFGRDDVLFSGQVGGGARQEIRRVMEPLPAAKLVLAVFSGIVVLVVGSFLLLLQRLPVDAYSAGLMPGVIGIQNLLVILSVCAWTRPPVWFFCLLGAGDLVMAMNVWQFLADVANETWPSLFNLGPHSGLDAFWRRGLQPAASLQGAHLPIPAEGGAHSVGRLPVAEERRLMPRRA